MLQIKTEASEEHMRNPKLEVYEASKIVLECADADFVSDALKKIGHPDFKVEYLINRLIWGHQHNNGKQVPPEVIEMAGFTSANTIYDDRLVAEWREFLTALLSYDIAIIARTNQKAHDHFVGEAATQS